MEFRRLKALLSSENGRVRSRGPDIGRVIHPVPSAGDAADHG